VATPPAHPTPAPPASPADSTTTPSFGNVPNVHDLFGVEILEALPERVVMRLPVDWKVQQPYGILHGGVSALLAESAASFGAALNVPAGRGVVGIELNASHVRSLSEGHLTATATPVRVGRTVQVWSIDLTDDDGRAICAARCTLSVIDLPESGFAPGATK
jgi:1,4-dihydroxy-2-naphthoyl-CoA hydrolase